MMKQQTGRLAPLQRRRGAIAVFVAFMLAAIIGMLAVSLEGGLLMDSRRQVQAAADAAALAAATELFINYPNITTTTPDPGGAAATAAQTSVSVNGFPNDGSTASLTTNIPPASGPFSGRSGYAEVILTYYQPRYFSRVWGVQATPVCARAVARARWGGTGKGIVVMDPTAKDALNASGSGSMTVTGGASVNVNSNNSIAAGMTGNGNLTASDFEIVGGYTGSLNGTIHTGVLPTADPLRYLPLPSVPPNGTTTTKSIGQGNKQYTLTPGYYTNLPNFTSGDVVILEQASANSSGGIYYIDGGGLKSTGASIIMDSNTSGGVMIYNNPSSSASSEEVQISGNSSGTVNLSPLTSGPYAGILLFQNRGSSVPLSLSGNGTFSMQGTFYAANAQLQVTGNGTATIGSQYISRTLTISGGGTTTINYTDNGTARLREVLLVE